jgi:hypothetical protein
MLINMFADKKFYQVNREERHFGFLLAASVIYESDFRKFFFELINSRIGQKFLNYNDFDIYAEVAIFRDYWNDLGNFKQKASLDETNNKRRIIIEMFLNYFNIDNAIIDKYPMFWTGEIGKSKIWFPGQWNIQGIETIQKERNLNGRELLRLRWACKAKPDIMIISEKSALFIELKVESGIGINNYGYNQEETQYDILKLAQLTVPMFKDTDFRRIMLTGDKDGLITWNEIKNKPTNKLVIKHMKHMPNENER